MKKMIMEFQNIIRRDYGGDVEVLVYEQNIT